MDTIVTLTLRKMNPFIQFGFNRLSILDLSKNANQPMTSNSGRYVVMCNGEITNYLKLITEMGLRPKDLRTNSDTEVLCHAIDYYGIRGQLIVSMECMQ